MKRSMVIGAIVSVHLLLVGCSVKYTANPVTNLDVSLKEICVIEDTRVRESFLPAYRTALEKKGFVVRILNPGSDVASCPLVSTYIGRWSWDFVLYMAYAEIAIYYNGTKIGDALYDAPRAGWALTTDIYDETDVKITTMVDKLFPDASLSK